MRYVNIEDLPGAEAVLGEAKKFMEFDQYLIGMGHRASDATIEIDVAATSMTKAFVTDYPAYKTEDIAAQLFSCRLMSVVNVDVNNYPENARQTGAAIRRYFERHNVKHLLFAGIDTGYGLAWLVLYRGEDKPFTGVEAKRAKFRLRAKLFELQELSKSSYVDTASRFAAPIKLSPMQVEVLVRMLRGLDEKEIRSQLHNMSRSSIWDHKRQIGKKLGGPRGTLALADRIFGPLPPPRSGK